LNPRGGGKKMIKPSNKGINTRKFRYQVTRWENLEALADLSSKFTYETILDDFNEDQWYGIDYIIKKNHLTGTYAAFVKDRRQPEKIAEIEGREERQGLDYVMHVLRGIVK
jgi:hypothetical protein